MRIPPIAWYITGHGFGHASRQIEIINRLRERLPAQSIRLRTAAKRWIFDLTLESAVEVEAAETDTGIAQIDSLRLDEAETLRRAAAFYATFDERVAKEAEYLRSIGAGLVVGDIPPLAFAAAHEARIPSIAIGNFTWDWIYEGYDPDEKGMPELVPLVREATAKASEFIRLPMWGGFEMAPPDRTHDIPLVARRSSRSPEETRRALGLPTDRTLVLLSFGGHGLSGLTPEAFKGFGDRYVAVLTGHLEMSNLRGGGLPVVEFDEQALYDAGWRYEDLVAAVDVVATKPGYGIIAECAANDTALLYTSRGHFVEYEVLVQEMPEFVRSQYIPKEALFAGEWVPYLEELLSQDRPMPADVTGAEQAAAHILARLHD
jgi:L-arabinokinase